jgi:hypothetical protein
MPLANCPRCKQMFNKLTSIAICPSCHQQEESDFERVYRYLQTHPLETIDQVAEATEVEAAQILRFYQSGRLLAGEAGYPCQRCQAPTQRGVYCEKCTRELQTQMRSSLSGALGPDQRGGSKR